eukprot:4792689-Amphidinium_carterae.1
MLEATRSPWPFRYPRLMPKPSGRTERTGARVHQPTVRDSVRITHALSTCKPGINATALTAGYFPGDACPLTHRELTKVIQDIATRAGWKIETGRLAAHALRVSGA